ncbi:MAG: hypothetical protein HKL80_01390 [Acidimicrobiales bacterium]|nr:hypothetical protein [Acidimicrobiales bacterium]
MSSNEVGRSGKLLSFSTVLISIALIAISSAGIIRLRSALTYPTFSYGISSYAHAFINRSLFIAGLFGLIAIGLNQWIRKLELKTAQSRFLSKAILASLLSCVTFISGIVVIEIWPEYRELPQATGVFPNTGFGGYRIYENVNSISAQWKVPEISSGTPNSLAATWIGAQGKSSPIQFIQIGTNEAVDASGGIYYEAFWADTATSFYPRDIMNIEAGDSIFVKMVRTGSGWLLTFQDNNTGVSEPIQVPFGAGEQFTEGEWIQEDPPPSLSSPTDVPYPVMPQPTFEKLAINGSPPSLSRQNAQVLETFGGSFFVPTTFRNDSFGFTLPTGTALEYLRLSWAFNSDQSRYLYETQSWNSLSFKDRSREVNTLKNAFLQFASGLTKGNWPKATEQYIAPAAQRSITISNDLIVWEKAGFPATGSTYLKLKSDQDNNSVTIKLRATLDLPPPN